LFFTLFQGERIKMNQKRILVRHTFWPLSLYHLFIYLHMASTSDSFDLAVNKQFISEEELSINQKTTSYDLDHIYLEFIVRHWLV
jgi:hypothetical protein